LASSQRSSPGIGTENRRACTYYHQYLEPKGEIKYVEHSESYPEDDRRGIPSMQAQSKAHPETDTSASTSIEWSRRGMHTSFACFRPAWRDERLHSG
jgi:hypothetical protein